MIPMSKTTTYILIGGGLLVAVLLVTSKSSPLKLGSGASASSGTGSAGWLTGLGNAGTGLSNLWDSISGTFSSDDTAPVDTSVG